MNHQTQAVTRHLAATALLACMLAACATAPGQPQGLPERAQARWDALLAQDFTTAYGYLSPGARSSLSEVDFTIAFRTRRVQYDSASYLDHTCEGEACVVRMRVGYTLAGALRGVPEFKSKAVVEEKWVRVEGKWWFLENN